MKSGSKDHSIPIETATWLFCLSLLIYFLRVPLLLGHTTYAHDNFFWNYPLFHYFSETLLNGNLPLWNYFSHGGEPFYPIWGVVRLSDPSTIFGIMAGSFFTNDSVLLFNWVKFAQIMLWSLGIYLLLRPVARNLCTRLVLIFILCFSSIVLSVFRQDGIHSQFFWVPFIAIQLSRILLSGRHSFSNWALLGVLIGLNWQAYHFVGTWLFFLFLLTGLLIFRRDLLQALWLRQGLFPRLGMMAAILVLMKLPSVVLLTETSDFVFPARMVEPGYQETASRGGPLQYEGGPQNVTESFLRMPFSMVRYSGSFSRLIDFVQMASPRANSMYDASKYAWGEPSEALLYIGLLPWLFAIIGVVFGRHPLKRPVLFVLACTGLTMLGPPAGLHAVIYQLYPPAWFLRHTHLLALFFSMELLFFCVLGCDLVVEHFRTTAPSRIWLSKFFPRGDFLIFTAATAIFYYGIRWINEHSKDSNANVWLVLAAMAAIMIYLVRSGRRNAGLAAFVAVHFVFVFKGTGFPRELISSYLQFMFLPLLVLSYGPGLFQKLKISRETAFSIALGVLVIMIGSDLTRVFQYAKRVYATAPALGQVKTASPVDTTFQQTPFSSMSRLEQVCLRVMADQDIRYPEVFFRRPVAFSAEFQEPNRVGRECWGFRLPLRFIPNSPEILQAASTRKRWNSFLLPKGYFELIHAKLSPEALYQTFMIGELPVGFLDDISQAVNLPIASPASGTFQYSLKKFTPNDLWLQVSASKAGYLYWADGFDKNWTATVNETPVPVQRVNMAFKAVAVKPESQLVKFEYRPNRFLRAMYVYWTLAIVGFLLFLVELWITRTSAKPLSLPE